MQKRLIGYVLLTVCVCAVIMSVSYFYTRECKFEGNCEVKFLSNKPAMLTSGTTECPNICTSGACVLDSDYFLHTVNTSADPCEDFYSFACGKFERFRPEDSFDEAGFMQKTLFVRMKEVLENIKSPLESPAGKMKTIYDSCVSSSDLSSEVSILLEYLDQFGIHGWPNLEEDFQFSQPTLAEALANIASYKGFSFMTFEPQEETDNGTTSNGLLRLEITGGLGVMYDKNIDDEEVVTQLERLVFKLLKHIGADDSNANRSLEDMQETRTSFDLLLNTTSNDTQDALIQCFDDSYNVSILQKDNTSMELNGESDVTAKTFTFICAALKHFVEYNKLDNVYSKDEAKLKNIEYFRGLNLLMTGTSQRSLANYMALRFMLANCGLMDTISKALTLTYLPKLDDDFDTTWMTRWKHCVSWTHNLLHFILGFEYAKQEFSTKVVEEIRDIFQTYQDVAASYVSNQTWIEEDHRNNLSSIVKSFINKFNDDLDTFNTTILDVFYSDLEPNKVSFLKNVLEIRKQDQKSTLLLGRTKEFKKISEVKGESPLFVNAQYWNKTIWLTYGLLLTPIYVPNRPKFLNLFSVGNTVGHEMGHGIQRMFRHNETVDDATMENYRRKEECLKEQYLQYDITSIGQKINVTMSFTDDEADLIGTQLDQKVMEIILTEADAKDKFSLPVFKLSTRQLLYISNAQFWCNELTPEELRLRFNKRYWHSPNEIRVTGMMQNSRGFSEAFQCSEGSNMNPVHKCAFFE